MALRRSVRSVMENRYFEIGGQVYKQQKGSPIGLDLLVYMTKWDRKLLNKLKCVGLKVELYNCYVDDVVLMWAIEL